MVEAKLGAKAGAGNTILFSHMHDRKDLNYLRHFHCSGSLESEARAGD